MGFNVFVSYSWANSAERRAVAVELAALPQVRVLVDKDAIGPGDPIHKGVSQLIEIAHCVVVFLTKEGLASNEVRDELVRCHERAKLIIPVVDDGTPLESLPWFLRDVRHIPYSARSFDTVVETLLDRIRGLARPLDEALLASLPPALRKLLDSGARFIDLRGLASANSPQADVMCELGMRNSDAVFVFRASAGSLVSEVAEALAWELLPDMRKDDYEWLLVKADGADRRRHTGFLTFEMAGIRTGDRVLLLGNHRQPSWAPRAM